MAELNYWQAIGLDPLWVRRKQALELPTESILSEPIETVLETATTSALSNEGFDQKELVASAVEELTIIAPAPAPAPAPLIPITPSESNIVPLQQMLESVQIAKDQQLADTVISSSNMLPIDIANLDWPALLSHIDACRACSLGCSRTNAVPGVGALNAPWMIIGEAPGADEDRQGEPFVGQAGKLLDLMLTSLGLSRKENVYIANILKCRPPNNRRPEKAEVQACIPFLYRQLALVQPKVLLVLGATAAHALLDTDEPIGKLRGRVHQYQGLPMIVTYHPAYLLRSPAEKAKTWADLCLLVKVMQESVTAQS